MADQPAPGRDALAEGRRIYLGNLLYSVQPGDVEDVLRQSGFADSFEKLHISIDSVSGRNPGYCFAEFTSREEADRALDSLPGITIFDRPVKVGPCNPKTASSGPSQSRWGSNRGEGRSDREYNPNYQRRSEWKGSDRDSARSGQRDGEPGERNQRPTDKAQLYIGGLGVTTDQAQHDAEIQDILAGYEYTTIGKRITPRAETRATPGNHHYCFVDFSTADEADRAMRELNGKEIEGGTLRVSMPRSRGPTFEQGGNNGWRNSPDSGSRQSNHSSYGRRPQQEGSPQEGQERPERREPTEKQRTIMTSNNWRSSAAAN
ncbi:uncharacterized protein C8A04DRAFT_11469 [Dichotomopilus funicola]|uniref:RRM domain-containing protein n=1 Tax=Dichotomopilus funicola TaxID=1934379 RepID=A0AAN6V5H3_9PEZI|nr:hypothetical protein C8A04DRAFT_11469 [Dichotomopilus funicola]